MDIITLKEMTKALEHKMKLNKEKAQKLAEFIMDAFGYENRIIDNVLKPDERQIFYMLEGEGFLTTEREQTRLYDGREWLTHYWELKKKTIRHYAQHQTTLRKTKIIRSSLKKEPQSIYNSITDDMWLMRKIINRKAI